MEVTDKLKLPKYRCTGVALGTYELSLTSSDQVDAMTYLDLDYIDTSVCYNNDALVGRILKDSHKHSLFTTMKLISKIPPQMTNEYEFMMSHHLYCLGVSKIDIMLIHNPRAPWIELAKKLESDSRVLKVGVSNFSIDDLETYKKELGHYPLYNEMEINPNYDDEELIKFCHDNGIKIIAYAILGGKYNAMRNISAYTLDHLLAFACYRAEIVIVRSDLSSRVSKMVDTIRSSFSKGLESPSILVDEDLLKSGNSVMNKSIIPDQYTLPTNQSFTKLSGVRILGSDEDSEAVVPNYVKSTSDSESDIESTRIKAFKISDDLVDNLLDRTSEINELLGIDGIDGTDGIPEYEFLTDYQVFYRYHFMDWIMDKYSNPMKYHIDFRLMPDKFVVVIMNNAYDPVFRYSLSVSLVDKDNKLSKIRVLNGSKCKLIVSIVEF